MRDSPRIFITDELVMCEAITLSQNHAHYLNNVMRLNSVGAEVLVFNGKDGLWQCQIKEIGKKFCTIMPVLQIEEQDTQSPLILYFAPIKGGRTESIIEKATELGATQIVPIITERTIVRKTNADKLHLIAIEAAEQCERLNVPQIVDALTLDEFLSMDLGSQTIFFADESQANPSIISFKISADQSVGLLIGPEGGFSARERDKILSVKNFQSISLGRNILRADTACFAGLSIIQSQRGDW